VVRLLASCAAAVALLLTAAPEPAGAMSCAAAVIVEDRILFGTGVERVRDLPPRGRAIAAIEPGCGDADRRITVWTLRGLPPRLAVYREGDGVYEARGSLTVLAGHPLHAALRHRELRPVARRGCVAAATVRGSVAGGYDGIALALRTRAGAPVRVRLDRRTRLANRPAYQPLRDGQQVAIRTSRCGRKLVAERIAFAGPTVPAERVSMRTDTDGGIGVLALALLLAIAVAAVCTAVWCIRSVTD
jgi:hypothetical protein